MANKTNDAALEQAKDLPGFSQGVRPNAALRDIVVAQPICPNSQIRGRVVNGQFEPPELQPGMENCQLAGGEWWKECEAKGHNPYWRKVRVYTTVDIEEKDESTGETYVVGTKKRVREVLVPNVTSLSPSVVHNSGVTIRRKMRYCGYKRLSDLGISERCQFRACQKPVQYRAEGYGDYCSLEHLNLIAARDEGEFLTDTNVQGLNAGYEVQAEKKRRRQLQSTMPRDVEKVS